LLPDCRKPKVCAYLERAFIMRERNRPEIRKLRVSEVWAGVDESFAVTMMRYHTKQPALLRPFIRASDPAMTAAQPWANMLWLGLAAPQDVFKMVRNSTGLSLQGRCMFDAALCTFLALQTCFHARQPPDMSNPAPANLLADRAVCLLCCMQLLHECNHGSKGNPIACEYTTGGNFLHAVLQHRPLVSSPLLCAYHCSSAPDYSRLAVLQVATSVLTAV
jgi:hypothetical protein